MAIPLEEIIARLQILGGTQQGGSTAYASFLPILNSQGVLDPSFFQDTILNHVHDVADEAARLNLHNTASTLKIGDIAVQANNQTSYVLSTNDGSNASDWRAVGSTYANTATGVSFDPTYTGLTATDMQGAIDALYDKAVIVDANRTITALHTFNRTGAPFALGVGARGQLVTGLTAQFLGANNQDAAYFTNASNIGTGTLNPLRLSGTYPISISGTAAVASLAVNAQTAATATNAINADDALRAVDATNADLAAVAEVANSLKDKTDTAQTGAFYQNAGNLTDGVLPAGRFTDSSHGQRAGGDLHAVATTSAPGFMSETDKAKLNAILDGAEPNQNAFSRVTVGAVTVQAANETDVFTIATSGAITATANDTTKTITLGLTLAGLLHSDLGGLTTGDDHTQYVHKDVDRTITATHTFNPPVQGPAFILGVNAQDELIFGLNAELFQGHEPSYFQDASNLITGFIDPARFNPGATYPIQNISGSAAGNLPLTGGTLTGPLVVPTLRVTTLGGTGLRVPMVDASGNFSATPGATTDDIPETASNKYVSDANILDAAKRIVADTATIIWDTTDPNFISANLGTITTDDVEEGVEPTRKYVSWAAVSNVLDLGASLLLNGSNQLVVDSATAATPNKLVMRDSSAGITAAAITATSITATGTIAAPAMTVANAPAGGTNVVNKDYVDSILIGGHSHDLAAYGLPVTPVADEAARLALSTAEVGDFVYQTGNATYYILTARPASAANNWQLFITDPLTTANKDGFISGKTLGKLLRIASLNDSRAVAPIFCPDIRLAEPINPGGVAYTNSNWRKYNCQSVQVHGRYGKQYLLMLRVRGWAQKQHLWRLRVSDYVGAEGEMVIALNEHNLTQPLLNLNPPNAPQAVFDSTYEYVDKVVPIFVMGRSNIILEHYAFDGKFTTGQNAKFPGIPPYSTNGTLISFDGGFMHVQAIGVTSTITDEPFNPYSPDLLMLQYEGEVTTGGISSFLGAQSQQDANYDGANIIDKQVTITRYAPGTPGANGLPTFTIVDDLTAATSIEKIDNRCNYTVFNKLSGFSGYLRVNNSISSGPGLSKEAGLGASFDDEIGNKFASSFTLSDSSLEIFGQDYTIDTMDVFTIGDLINAINIAGVGATAAYENDRLIITLPDIHDETTDIAPPVLYPLGHPLRIMRVAFGVDGVRHKGISIPVCSGINDQDLVVDANFARPLSLTTGIATFKIDDLSFDINVATQYVYDIINTVNSGGKHILDYDQDTNEFTLRYADIAGRTDNLLAPIAFDVKGNLMQIMGLEKESHGNRDFPAEAVHSLLYTDSGVVVGGNFRNYCGVTSPGLAKLKLNGKPDPFFNIRDGFDGPIYSLANVTVDTNGDILVAGLDPVAFQGNKKRIVHRIKQDGSLSTSTTVSNYTGDEQGKILGVMGFDTGDFIVLTPRKLFLYAQNGTLKTTYTGTKSFHGMTKYKVAGSGATARTLFMLTSAAYSSPTTTQKFNNIGEPLGLRMMSYDHTSSVISIDSDWDNMPVWNAGTSSYGPGAGTGAEASCAYPITAIRGESGLDSYVICGNSGTYWGSGEINYPGNTSWNERGSGNLLLYSENYLFLSGTYENWHWKINGDGLLNNGVPRITTEYDSTGKLYSTVSNTAAEPDDIGYLYQDVDCSLIRLYQNGTPQANNGGITYRFSVLIKRDTEDEVFPYFGLRFTTPPGGNAEQFTVGVRFKTSNGAYDVASSPGGPTPTIEVTPNSASNPTAYTLQISVTDKTPGNMQVTPVIYPAYTTTFVGGAAEPCTRDITISGASLRFGPWNSNYVQTTGTQLFPSNEGTGPNFRGLYKIGLEGDKKGKAWEGFATHIIPSEIQAHPIPFGVDKQNRIYIGGPISQIAKAGGTLQTVTPWRLYRLTADGKFDKEFPFNDIVTSCVITPNDQLIVGGRFTCYNKRAASKIIFLDTEGNVLDSIEPSKDDIIVSPQQPNVVLYPENKDKLWLDTYTEPPVLKVYDETTSQWVTALTASRRVSDPIIIPQPAGALIDPEKIWIQVPGFTIKVDDHSAPTDVLVNYRLGSNTAEPNYVYNPDPVEGGIVLSAPGTTIYVDAFTPASADWFKSRTVYETFIVRNPAPTPTITATPAGNGYTIDIVTNAAGGKISYYKFDTAIGAPETVVWTNTELSTVSFSISSSTTIVAKARVAGYRDSEFATLVQDIVYTAPVFSEVWGQPQGPAIGIAAGAGANAILYAATPTAETTPEPTMANYNGPNRPSSLVLVQAASTNFYTRDNPAWGNGTTLCIKARSVYYDSSSGKVVSESPTVTKNTTRSPAPIISPWGSITKNGPGDYSIYVITDNVAPYVTIPHQESENPEPNMLMYIPEGGEAGHYQSEVVIVPDPAVYTDFYLNVRVGTSGPAGSTVWESAKQRTKFYWSRAAATITTNSHADYGIYSINITPNDVTNTIKYSVRGNETFNRTTGGYTYTQGTAIRIDNLPEDCFVNDVLTVRVLEYKPSESAVYDVIKTQQFNRYAVPEVYNKLISNADGGATLLEAGGANYLTFNEDATPALLTAQETRDPAVASYTLMATYNDAEAMLYDSENADFEQKITALATNVNFSPPDEAVNSGTLALRLRLFKPSYLPSRMISIPISMRMTPVVFTPQTGSIISYESTPEAGGTGYALDEVITLAGGTGGTFKVTRIDETASNKVVAVEHVARGTSYTTGIKAQSATTGSGTGCTIKINAVGSNFSPAGKVTMSCSLGTAVIHYTIDGSTPTLNSRKYETPITIKAGAKVQAIATKLGWQPSAVTTATYIINDIFTEDKYSIINLKCGTPLDETAGLTTDRVLLINNPDGTFRQAGGAAFQGGHTLVKNWQGNAQVGLGTTDYWNVIKPAQEEVWTEPRDVDGKGNANGSLQVRKYFGVKEATKYFGDNIDVYQESGANGSKPITGLENCGLTSEYGSNSVLLHLRGLKSGKYLMLAYGQKTEFDLDMYSGVCINQGTKSKGFYNYGYQLFNINSIPSQKSYTKGVFPVRVFIVKGIKIKDLTPTPPQYEWVVKQVGTTYLPYDRWGLIKNNANALKNQIFHNADTWDPAINSKITEQGVIYVPQTAEYTLTAAGGQIIPGTAKKISESDNQLIVGTVEAGTAINNVSRASLHQLPGQPTIASILVGYPDARQIPNIPPATGSSAPYNISQCWDIVALAPGLYSSQYTKYPSITSYNEAPDSVDAFVTNDIQYAKPIETTRVKASTVLPIQNNYLRLDIQSYVLGYAYLATYINTLTLRGKNYYEMRVDNRYNNTSGYPFNQLGSFYGLVPADGTSFNPGSGNTYSGPIFVPSTVASNYYIYSTAAAGAVSAQNAIANMLNTIETGLTSITGGVGALPGTVIWCSGKVT